MSSGYTDAPPGCWQTSSPGCRAEVSVFLLAVPVGRSFDSFRLSVLFATSVFATQQFTYKPAAKSFILFAKNEF